MVDTIIEGKTRTRREFCSFYTESDPILTYMVKRLGVEKGDEILEPCAGDGVFIEKILDTSMGKQIKIEALDLNQDAIEQLRKRFSDNINVTVRQADTLIDTAFDLFSKNNCTYSKIIGNPPYGAWLDYKKRDLLKKLYGGYVKETYTLFLRRCLELLKENGRLVFIIPDTFLALHLHKALRKRLLESTKIEEVLLIPSRFFPGVNFGYSNLCIITFTKTYYNKDNKINIVSVQNSIQKLYSIAEGNYAAADSFESIQQKKVLESVDYAFLLGGNTKIRKLVNEAKVKLRDIANCVTGFCSGDNKRFMVVKDTSVKNSKGYRVADASLIDFDFLKRKNLLDGLYNEKKFIPILKGGNGIFTKDTEWFVKWDKDTVAFYKKNSAARFQNSHYYFNNGIGVPMVKSNQVHAFSLENRLFDQSIVGIFPVEKKYFNFLLAFLNSDVYNKILKIINHTANNSANYVKKIPIIINSNTLKIIDNIMEAFCKNKDIEVALLRINEYFNRLYKI